MTRYAKDPKPVPTRKRRGRYDRWEEVGGNDDTLERLNEAIRENFVNGVPWELWSDPQKNHYAYYWVGQRCASVLPENGYNMKPVMDKLKVFLDLENTEEGREISKMLEEMECNDEA